MINYFVSWQIISVFVYGVQSTIINYKHNVIKLYLSIPVISYTDFWRENMTILLINFETYKTLFLIIFALQDNRSHMQNL